MSTQTNDPKAVFDAWMKDFPNQFPEVFDEMNSNHNPFIEDQQEYTYQAVRNGLKFLEEVALPWPGSESFSLGEDATWGYIRFLQCLSGAIEFEDKHRRDGGFELPDTKDEDH